MFVLIVLVIWRFKYEVYPFYVFCNMSALTLSPLIDSYIDLDKIMFEWIHYNSIHGSQ